MGNALVMMVVREEDLTLNGLHARDPKTGDIVPLKTKMLASYEDTLDANPDAFWTLEVRTRDVWRLPAEPSEEHGYDWHWDASVLATHREVVKHSLESFMNRALEGLDEMVRSGWWILARARAKVAELREVPHTAREIETKAKRR